MHNLHTVGNLSLFVLAYLDNNNRMSSIFWLFLSVQIPIAVFLWPRKPADKEFMAQAPWQLSRLT